MKAKNLLFILGAVSIGSIYSCSKTSYTPLNEEVLQDFQRVLSVKNEVPAPAGRTETGTLHFQLLPDSSVRYDFTVNDLQAGDALVAAHIHTGDPVTNGPIVLDLRPKIINNYGTGVVYNIRPSLIDSMMNPNIELYFNAHSMRVPSGLVRAQLNRNITMQADVALTGAQVVPAVNTTATGIAYLRMTEDKRLYSKIQVNNIEPNESLTMAHLHQGAIGANGSLVTTLASSPSDFGVSKVTTVSDSVYNIILRNRVYVDVHSVNSPAGKLRGQVRN